MARPTIKDVAVRAGVSPAAVSLYLNSKPGIGAAAQERIAAAIDMLGYIPRPSARSNGFIGLVVEKLPLSLRGDHFYADVTEGIQQEAERLGYSLAISVLTSAQAALPRIIQEQQVVGVLAIGGGDVNDDLLHAIAERGFPLVTVDNQSDLRALNNVVVDNFWGAYRVTQHLIALGHTRIAIIRGPDKYKSLTERYHGYLQALIDANLAPESALIQPPLSKGIPRKGYREMQALLELIPLPTAVFAVSDRTALGAMDALLAQGVRVPQDISIAGFDDMPPDAYTHIPLTSVTSARFEMGRVTMQRLHTLINDSSLTPIKIVMPTQVVVRQSTGASKDHVQVE